MISVAEDVRADGPRAVGGLAAGWLSVAIATVCTGVLLAVLHAYGWVGPRPLYVLLGLLLGSVVLSHIGRVVWRNEATDVQLNVIVALKILGVTVLMYVTGWGPVLAISYAFIVADVVSEYGARAARPALAFIIAALAGGQALVITGVIHTYVPQPEIHVIAVLGGLGVLFVVHDIGRRTHHHEQATGELLALFAHNPAPMFIVDVETRGFLDVNKAACDLYGYTRDEFLARRLDELRPEADIEEFLTRFRDRPAGFKRFQTRHVLTNGDLIEVDVSAHDLVFDGRPAVLATLIDVTERNTLEVQYRHLALHDPLTGLGNRTSFSHEIDEARKNLHNHGGPIAVLVADLDGFKTVNDSLGHPAGDTILVEVARRFRAALRDSDAIARLGGDEFAILLQGISEPEHAAEIARRLMRTLATPIPLGSGSVTIHASIGIAIEGRKRASPDELLRNADAAMYRAKADGKNCYRFFERSMHAAALMRMELSESLGRALANDELRLVYQPVVHAGSGAVSGLEALVRWDHPKNGVVPPLDFIPLAEETGLIVDIGRWVLNDATREISRWRGTFGTDPSPLGISVNVSRRQLADMEFVDDVLRAVATTSIARSSLTLEITESVLASDTEAERAHLQALREVGVRIAIDDFGTGYSSLAALRDLPIDIVKIDRKFIRNVPDDRESAKVVAAIIDLAHALGLQTVAEGVERTDQAECLREIGCDLLQGYAICHPLPPKEVHQFLQARLMHGQSVEMSGGA